MITFSNPRLAVTIEDWPSGSKTVACTFRAETKKGRMRIAKQTTGKPSLTVYYAKMAIVDGSNGRTYLLGYSAVKGTAN